MFAVLRYSLKDPHILMVILKNRHFIFSSSYFTLQNCVPSEHTEYNDQVKNKADTLQTPANTAKWNRDSWSNLEVKNIWGSNFTLQGYLNAFDVSSVWFIREVSGLPWAVRQLQRQFHGEGFYNHQCMLGAHIRVSFIWTEENSFVVYNSQCSH